MFQIFLENNSKRFDVFQSDDAYNPDRMYDLVAVVVVVVITVRDLMCFSLMMRIIPTECTTWWL